MEEFKIADEFSDKGEFEKAFEIFLQGAENGDVDAMTRVATMYSQGEGVKLDFNQAIEWDLKAIECGSTTAILNLAITYRMKGDVRMARYYFEKALEAGEGEAAIQLAKLYMVSEKETEKIVNYLNIAINHKNMYEVSLEEAGKLLKELEKEL